MIVLDDIHKFLTTKTLHGYINGIPGNISVYLKLKNSVVASQVSKLMNKHVLQYLGLTPSHMRSWEEADIIPEVCKEGPAGKRAIVSLIF